MRQPVWDRFPFLLRGKAPSNAELWSFYSSELRFGPKGYLLYFFLSPFSLFSTWLFLLVPCFRIPGGSLWADIMSTFVPLPAPSWKNRKPPLLFLLQLVPLLPSQGLTWRAASAGLVSIVIVPPFSQVLSVGGLAWVVCLTAYRRSLEPRDSYCSLLIFLTYTSYLSGLECIFQSINYFLGSLYSQVRSHSSVRHGILYLVREDRHADIFLKDTPLSDNLAVIPHLTSSCRVCVLTIAWGGIAPYTMWRTHLRISSAHS